MADWGAAQDPPHIPDDDELTKSVRVDGRPFKASGRRVRRESRGWSFDDISGTWSERIVLAILLLAGIGLAVFLGAGRGPFRSGPESDTEATTAAPAISSDPVDEASESATGVDGSATDSGDEGAGQGAGDATRPSPPQTTVAPSTSTTTVRRPATTRPSTPETTDRTTPDSSASTASTATTRPGSTVTGSPTTTGRPPTTAPPATTPRPTTTRRPATTARPTTSSTQGPGPNAVSFNGNLYELVSTRSMGWSSAAAIAAERGGHLPFIDSRAENDFIRSTFGPGNPIWLGLRDPSGGGNWRWTDGSSPSFVNWRADQPDYDEAQGPYYARIGFADGGWADSYNTTTRFFVDGRWIDRAIYTVVEFEGSGGLRFADIDSDDGDDLDEDTNEDTNEDTVD